MGATIYYRPVMANREILEHVWAPSSFLDSVKRAFGVKQFPLRLDRKDVPILQGMSAMHTDREHNPYDELIKLIEHLKCIEIWPEW